MFVASWSMSAVAFPGFSVLIKSSAADDKSIRATEHFKLVCVFPPTVLFDAVARFATMIGGASGVSAHI